MNGDALSEASTEPAEDEPCPPSPTPPPRKSQQLEVAPAAPAVPAPGPRGTFRRAAASKLAAMRRGQLTRRELFNTEEKSHDPKLRLQWTHTNTRGRSFSSRVVACGVSLLVLILAISAVLALGLLDSSSSQPTTTPSTPIVVPEVEFHLSLGPHTPATAHRRRLRPAADLHAIELAVAAQVPEAERVEVRPLPNGELDVIVHLRPTSDATTAAQEELTAESEVDSALFLLLLERVLVGLFRLKRRCLALGQLPPVRHWSRRLGF